MEWRAAAGELGLGEFEEVLAPEWEASQATAPAGESEFLTPEFVARACRDTCVSADVPEAALRAATRVAASEALSALFWHFHYLLYGSGTANWPSIHKWPLVEALQPALGEEAGRFYLLVLLSGLPTMRAAHRAHGVPEAVVRETLGDLQLWLETEREREPEAIPSLHPYNVSWLSNHFRANLYRLGRLQYQFGGFGSRIRVYRHQASRAVLALSTDGVKFRANGQIDGKGEATDGWTARLVVTDEAVTGTPIVPEGRALGQEVTLPLSEWRQVLSPEDPVLHLHIPAGSPMSHQACGESFAQAMEFFPKHYPDYRFVAFCCGSWILNTWLEELVPPTSNLLRFQREVYLYPIDLWPPTMISRVFGELPEDLSQAPRDTGLQRAILDVLQAGRDLEVGAGGCFLFPEDLNWGAEVYRRQRLPEGLLHAK